MKHAQRKKQVATSSNKSRECEIMDALKVYEQEANPNGDKAFEPQVLRLKSFIS